MLDRWSQESFGNKLNKPYAHIMFGARQTGKSTLIKNLLPEDATIFDLSEPAARASFSARPGDFVKICKAIPRGKSPHYVFIDEVQAVPALFDAVQHLYDSDKNRFRFVLCGSSARKLRLTGANLLPGRSFLHHLYPLVMNEQPYADARSSSILLKLPGNKLSNPFPSWSLIERLTYGSLPGIVTAGIEDRGDLLKSYAVIYLEEEIRREALVKDWGAFLRFSQMAAAESGKIVNFAAISKETGISQPTVKSYYQLLEDIYVGFRVQAFTQSQRKNLLSTPRFLFFDLGVRHAAAGLTPSADTVKADPGAIFEQWVGIELWKRLQYIGGKLMYQRTKDGSEIDYIVDAEGSLIPMEVKWTEKPSMQDARHLLTFVEENRKCCSQGYIICRCEHLMKLHDRITAVPWFMI